MSVDTTEEDKFFVDVMSSILASLANVDVTDPRITDFIQSVPSDDRLDLVDKLSMVIAKFIDGRPNLQPLIAGESHGRS